MQTSETLIKITPALLAVQTKTPTLGKDKQGYGYRYVTLDHIIETLKPICNAEGIAIIQTVGNADNAVCITTRLQHVSGEFIEDSFQLPATTMKGVNNTQAMGASISYGRRYGLTAILSIATDEDTDGIVKAEKPQQQKPVNKLNELVKQGISAEEISKYILDNMKTTPDKLTEKQTIEVYNKLKVK